jgi:hypothetical protein
LVYLYNHINSFLLSSNPLFDISILAHIHSFHIQSKMGSIGHSTDSIIATLDGVHPHQFGGDEVERLRVRAAARRLLARVESPYERAWGFGFEHPAVFAALQTCIDLDIWKAWTKDGGGKKTIDDLVAMTGRDVGANLLREFVPPCL